MFILTMGDVPMIDATGVGALEEFLQRCQMHGAELIICGVQPQPHMVLNRMDFAKK